MNRWLTPTVALLVGCGIGATLVHSVHAQAKPRAYTIAEIDVTDAATF